MTHPLEDEDITVSVLVEHNPTGLQAQGTAEAVADGPPDVADALVKAMEQAMDDLLGQLEVQGG